MWWGGRSRGKYPTPCEDEREAENSQDRQPDVVGKGFVEDGHADCDDVDACDNVGDRTDDRDPASLQSGLEGKKSKDGHNHEHVRIW